jgi:transmembrane sensor
MGSGEYVSGPNESTTATLADGTIVRMAPNSRLRILDRPERREVDLEGHAFFAVARMPEQPFTVRTPIGDVTALGTRFDVRVGEDLRVVVAEGRVAIGDVDQRVEVGAGEMSLIADGRVTQPVRVDVRSLLAWMGRFIAFQSTPLPLAAAELEAEYGTRVVIADTLLAELMITGSYIDRSFEDVITIICGAISAQCSIEDGTATIGR